MVGVPRSKGCETCRARSIKCDELRPNCSQCRRGGRKCPGYERRLKFVDEKPRLERRLQPQKAEPSEPQVMQTIYRRQHRTQIVATFIEDLFPLEQGRRQHSFIGGWLWLVPSVLQQKDSLDLAAESVALGYFGMKSTSKPMIMQSYSVYSNALQCLSRALRHNEQKFCSETLCATLLLVHYERFMSVKGTSWIQHTSGIRQLIQLRGPDRHRSGVEHAILMASKSYIIAEALINQKACFLDEPEWKSIQMIGDFSPLIPPSYLLFHEGLTYFASIPGLLEAAKLLKQRNVTKLSYSSIVLKANRIRSQMIEWYNRLEHMPEEPLRTPSTPDKSYHDLEKGYTFRDPITAAFAVNYCAYLILLNQTLDSVGHTAAHTHLEENASLARDIGMATSYCSRAGFCGAQAMALTLPIALKAASEDDVSWIQECMRVFTDLGHTLVLHSTISREAIN